MAEDPSSEVTPASDPSPPKPQNNAVKIVAILAAVGCGCLGLPLLLILLGIIGSIALPSFLNQAEVARESEARNTVGALTRGQQAYFLQHGGFARSIDALGLGIQAETENFRYGIAPPTDDSVTVIAVPKREGLSSFVGGAFVIDAGGGATTVVGICQSDQPLVQALPPPVLTAELTVECPPGTTSLN